MNPIWNFQPDDQLYVDGNAYSFVSQSKTGVVVDTVANRGMFETFSFKNLTKLFQSARLRYDRGYFSKDRADRRRRIGDIILSGLKDHVRSRVLWKTAWCDRFLELEAKKKVVRTHASVEKIIPDIKKVVDAERERQQKAGKQAQAGMEIRQFLTPTSRSLLEWIRNYERQGYSELAHVPRNAKGAPVLIRLDHESAKFLNECIDDYACPKRPTKLAIAKRTVRRFKKENRKRIAQAMAPLTVPSVRTITRWIARLDPYFTCVRRDGADAANRKFALFETGVEARYPLERVEIDEWEVDLMTLLTTSGAVETLSPEQLAEIERDRRVLCLAIDCATRCVVAMRLGATASSSLATSTLADIGLDKTEIAAAAGAKSTWNFYGGIGTVVADQGSAFISEAFHAAVVDVGANIEHPPAGIPMLRGRVERIFRTFTTELMILLSGRTFSNPVEKGDYDSKREAVLTDDVLYEVLVQFVVDVYHNQPHGGLAGETPANCWKRLSKKYGITPPPCGFTRRAVFGEEFEATVTGRGVRWYGIDYTCDALRQHFLHSPDRKVSLKLDPEDLGWAAVRIGETWHAAPALQKTFEGVALDDWKLTCRKLREKHRGEAVLVEDVVHDALAAISNKDRMARKRMRLVSPRLTQDKLEALNRDLFLGVTIDVAGGNEGVTPPENCDLLGRVIKVDQPPPTTVSPKANPSPKPPRRFRLEDD